MQNEASPGADGVLPTPGPYTGVPAPCAAQDWNARHVIALPWGPAARRRRRLTADRQAQEKAEEEAEELSRALSRLGVEQGVPSAVRGALEKRHLAAVRRDESPLPQLQVLTTLLSLVWAFNVGVQLWQGCAWAIESAPQGWRMLTEGVTNPDISPQIFLIKASIAGVLAGLMVLGLMVVLFVLPFWFAYTLRQGRIPKRVSDYRRYRLVSEISRAIRSWAEQSETAEAQDLADLDNKVFAHIRLIEEYVLLARRDLWATIPLPVYRREALSAHAGRTAARLRQTAAGVDHDRDATLKRLCEMLLTIADQYAQGKIGALLSETDADREIEPVTRPLRRRSAPRLFLVTVLTVAGAYGISLLELPNGAEGPAIAGITGLAVLLVYGRTSQRAERVLALFTG